MTEKLKRPPVKRKTGGRPPYRPTLEDRRTVEELKYCGEPESVIARAIGIDVDTLRKHFRDELDHGHAQRRKEVVGLLFQSARGGNVSAQKTLQEMGRAAGAAEALERRATPAPKLGKKEEQQQAAQGITGKFAPPPAPRIVVNNG